MVFSAHSVGGHAELNETGGAKVEERKRRYGAHFGNPPGLDLLNAQSASGLSDKAVSDHRLGDAGDEGAGEVEHLEGV
jgi:hypothetical protein